MALKRNRTESSSIHLSPTAATAAAKLMDAAAEPLRPRILTVASPMSGVGESERMKVGGFLERCHYCKKRIAQDSKVFMYSNLCAFCSTECRDLQMVLDKSAEGKRKIPNKKAVQAKGFTM
ncbi:hypothetical protein BUALT_Bualt13G0014100 [Buddleja alternifolia]|uniref:FLZ-type domain-containing protein n=1 Tax=Buddleja alternifolia TaxID=168488 RepID=A0AAV6WKW6_9LAMI|nr:hypothetical protein BUALT_Bualt13G0014100 [Buddleja alternifolia]